MAKKTSTPKKEPAAEKKSAAKKIPLFSDRLVAAVREKRSVAVVGIDPTLAMFPPKLATRAKKGRDGLHEALSEFCLGMVAAVADIVPAVKPNIAFFEAFGLHGLSVYKSVCLTAASMGLLVIGDIKRGDIGSTAEAYAHAHLDAPRLTREELAEAGEEDNEVFQEKVGDLLGPHDAVTLCPFLGTDSVAQFFVRGIERGQGMFVLVKTSNRSSQDIQDLRLDTGATVAERIALMVDRWGRLHHGKAGMASIGAVVGATHREELAEFRSLMPNTPFLVPGYGAQGGTADDVVDAFRADGTGAIVNASRSILTAWQKEKSHDWQGAARRAAEAMNDDLRGALTRAGKWSFK